MVYLAGAILSSTAILLLFRLFGRLQVNTFQTIVVNYFVAGIIGLLLAGDTHWRSMFSEGWLPWALLLGTGFISMFYLIGSCTIKNGITVTAIAHKISLVIPVVAGLTLYGESMDWIKLLAVILAVASVYLASVREKTPSPTTISFWWLILPFVVFFGSGIIDSIIQHIEHLFFVSGADHRFLSIMFFIAAMLGSIILVWRVMSGRSVITYKPLVGGIALGTVNYGSIFFIMKALNQPDMESSVVFPVNNIGVVCLSALAALVLFREPINRYNTLGIVLAVIAILLLTYELY